jgi:hypothetical protein
MTLQLVHAIVVPGGVCHLEEGHMNEVYKLLIDTKVFDQLI